VLLIIPSFNAGEKWQPVIDSIGMQDLSPLRVCVIDSGSQDQTVRLAREAGFEIEQIRSQDFDHGGTRERALKHVASTDEFAILMTQDAILASQDSLSILLEPFEDPKVGLVYGRQLPHVDATPLAAQARAFNYPNQSVAKTFADCVHLGIKTPFCSNSFAAYRLSALREVGGFPSKTIMGEDMLVASKLLKSGFTVYYQSKACVFHSHNYSLMDEFKRYFDTGVFHFQSREILADFGGVGGEGFKLLKSQLKLANQCPGFKRVGFVWEVLIRNALKLLAYQLGKHHTWLPLVLKKSMSMFKGYWVNS